MKEKTYTVRLSFDHGNKILIDLRGCGSIYIKPGNDYFFENAPMQFINYLVQLKRAGVTYKITKDKRGCYQTFNLSNYFNNDPYHNLTAIRKKDEVDLSVFTRKAKEKSREEVIQDLVDSEDVILDETPEEITDPDLEVVDMTKGEVIESVLNKINKEDLQPLTNGEEVVQEEISEDIKEDIKEDEETTENLDPEKEEVLTEDEEQGSSEDVDSKPEVKDYESMQKNELYAYAQELGLTNKDLGSDAVQEYWLKAEIKEAIKNHLESN